MRIAVIAPTHNEEDLLPQFLRHYAPQVDRIFLLDGESTDRTLAIASEYSNVEASTLSTGGLLNDLALVEGRMAKKAECVGRFDYVLLVDVDEFILPKAGGTLRAALQALPRAEIHGTRGFQMIRRPADPPYDPSRPLTEQYRWGIEDVLHLSKPVIARPEGDATWWAGFHLLQNRDNGPLKDPARAAFFLLHFSAFDEELYVRRAMDRARRISWQNRSLGLASHYFDPNEETYRKRFRLETSKAGAVRVL